MQKYTLTVLINEKVSEEARTAAFVEIKKSFSNLIKEDLWGVRSLSYDIKHMNKAFFAYFEFEAEPASIITLDKNIRLNEDIIRYLIIRKEEKKQKSKGKSTSENPKPEKEVVEADEKVTEVSKETKETKVTKVVEEPVKEKKVRSKK